MRARQASVSSTGETFLERMRSEACFKVSDAKSSEVSAKEIRDATAAAETGGEPITPGRGFHVLFYRVGKRRVN